MNDVDVAVLGGGISGLAASLLLEREGPSVAVFEEEDRPGGSIKTWRENGFLFELGPNTVLNNAFEIDALCEAAGVLDSQLRAAPASKKRYVIKGGQPVALPGGPLSFLGTRLFSLGAKLRLLKEPFISRPPPETEETIAGFARRRLGQEFLDYAVGPFVSGVYAGDPSRLSVKHATAKIHALEERYGSLIRGAIAKRKGPAPAGGLFSFPDGLETLPRAIADRLGDSWHSRCRVLEVQRRESTYAIRFSRNGVEEERAARTVVSALPAGATSSALRGLGGEFPAAIESLPYADVAVVCLGFQRGQVAQSLAGFGFLAPAVEKRHVLGCLFPSSLFPRRAPAGHVALTAFVGGAMHPDRVARSEDEILSDTLRDISPLLGISGDPVLHRVETWRPAIPQYVIGHGAHKAAARAFEEDNPGVFISGNLLYGVSVGDCIRNATAVAARVLEFLGVGRSPSTRRMP